MNLPYEIHLTLANDPGDKIRAAGLDLIVIDNHLPDGNLKREFLTSEIVRCELELQARREMEDQSEFLQKDFDIEIIRKKIETVPWHPNAPQRVPFDEKGYFEAHVHVHTPELFDRELLHCLNMHLSTRHDREYRILTMRARTTRYWFEKLLQDAREVLMRRNYIIGKTEVEYCIWDTNEAMDNDWMGV